MLRQLGEAFGEESKTICRPLDIIADIRGHILFLKEREQIPDRRHKICGPLHFARRI